MATYPIKMLKDEQGQPFLPYTSIQAIGDYTPDTETDINLTNYYNKEEVDAKINALYFSGTIEEYAELSDEAKTNYLIAVVSEEV